MCEEEWQRTAAQADRAGQEIQEHWEELGVGILPGPLLCFPEVSKS